MSLQLLEGLWTGSLFMGGASTVMIILMVVRRAVLSRGSATSNELRDAMLQSLTTDWTLLEQDVLRRFIRRRRQLANLITELDTLVRGPAFSDVIDHLARQGALSQLLKLLQYGNLEDKLAACEALSHFPSAYVVSHLEHLAKSGRPTRLRIAALRALLQMGQQPSVDTVIRWMGVNGSNIPAEATTILKMATLLHPAEALRRIAMSIDPPGVRAALIWAISEKGTYEALPVLENLTIDNDPQIRAAALHAIGEMRFCSDPSKLHYCLADGVAEVRAEAAAAIGKTGDATAIPMLVALLDDANWDVRFRAAWGLADLGDAGTTQLRTISFASDAHSRRARAAAMVLSERGL
jgi:HEAT repeat protein